MDRTEEDIAKVLLHYTEWLIEHVLVETSNKPEALVKSYEYKIKEVLKQINNT